MQLLKSKAISRHTQPTSERPQDGTDRREAGGVNTLLYTLFKGKTTQIQKAPSDLARNIVMTYICWILCCLVSAQRDQPSRQSSSTCFCRAVRFWSCWVDVATPFDEQDVAGLTNTVWLGWLSAASGDKPRSGATGGDAGCSGAP